MNCFRINIANILCGSGHAFVRKGERTKKKCPSAYAYTGVATSHGIIITKLIPKSYTMHEDDDTETAAGGDRDRGGQCRDHVIAWQGRSALRNMAKQAHKRMDDALMATLGDRERRTGPCTRWSYTASCHRGGGSDDRGPAPFLGNPRDVSFDVGRLARRRAALRRPATPAPQERSCEIH